MRQRKGRLARCLEESGRSTFLRETAPSAQPTSSGAAWAINDRRSQAECSRHEPGFRCVPCRYNRDLLELELRPTHEDVFQSQPSTVDEYLQQVHESTVVTAIQVSTSWFMYRCLGVKHPWLTRYELNGYHEGAGMPPSSAPPQEAQRQTDDTFQQFMADSLQANWQRAKRRLLDSMLPSGGQGGMAQSLSATTTAVSQPGSHQNSAGGQTSLTLDQAHLLQHSCRVSHRSQWEGAMLMCGIA